MNRFSKGSFWHQKKKLPVIFIHISFIIMLLGYLFTVFTGIKGRIHLREGETVNSFVTQKQKTQQLPFSITLKSFEIECFSGTNTPKNYKSEVAISDGKTQLSKTISLNAILSHQHYRFYQMSFDRDEKGSWFTVKYDPMGIFFSYSGYVLFAGSMLWFLLQKWRLYKKYTLV